MDTMLMLPKSPWIWTSDSYDRDNPVLVAFRRQMFLESVPEKMIVQLSADSRYRLYINGFSPVQGPCKGDGQVWYYDELDIAPYLRKGMNILAAVVLRYPASRNGNDSVWRTDLPGFYMEGAVTTDHTWKCKVMDKVAIRKANPFFEPLCIFETAAGDPAFYGWLADSYDDSEWSQAVPYLEMQVSKSISPGYLTPRPIPFLYERQRNFEKTFCIRQSVFSENDWDSMLHGGTITIPANCHEVVELSAGEEMTGYLRLLVSAGEKSVIRILQAESYGTVDAQSNSYMPDVHKTDRTDWQHGTLTGFSDIYTVGGFGTPEQPEDYQPFWFRTFRFVQLDITTGDVPLTIHAFDYRETGYPLDVKTQVTVSDESLAPVWEISLRTLKRCMHETYEDCPFYEQLQYSMDARSEILFTYMTSADDRMARRTMDDFFRSMRADGMINCCYPSYGPNVIPGFGIYYICMIHDHMMFFGDQALVKRYFPAVMQILDFYRNRIAENGLVARTSEGGMGKRYWSFIDWTERWQAGVPNAIACGYVTMDTLHYILGLQTAAELAEYIGLSDYAVLCRSDAEKAKIAVRAACMDANGILTDGPGYPEYSQHVQAFATITDTYSLDEAVKAMQNAMDSEQYTLCSVAMGWYLCRALEKTGLYARTNQMWELWRTMVKNKMTTCVESPGDTARSDCHAWSALPLYELPATTLGVRPAAPGFEKIAVHPVPGYMTNACGQVITPFGIIEVSWRLKNGEPIVSIKANTDVMKRLV